MKSENIREIYDRTAREYEEFVIPCKVCQYAMLIQALELKGDERVLDLGCGPGELSLEIARRLTDGYVVGVDISENMIRIAKRKASLANIENAEFLVGDVTNLTFRPGEFDVCVNSYLIHWIHDVRAFLRGIHGVLREGGRLGIISPSPEWYREIRHVYRAVMTRYAEHLPEHVLDEPVGVKIYGEEEMRELLASAGFTVNKFVSFRFMEAVPVEECLRRIGAKSGEAYLSFLPEEIREDVRREFLRAVAGISRDLITTESGHIVVAVKR